MPEEKCAIIASVSSDIGSAIARKWLNDGWKIAGTYRKKTDTVDELFSAGADLIPCEFKENGSIDSACKDLKKLDPSWDVLVMCPGTLNPIGSFLECDSDEWEESIKVNFINQLRMVRRLLPSRNKKSSPLVLFFAGGGTNDAPVNYSAYIVSKIALIKMTELLDAEIPDTRFAIIGPGWVKTKIHQETLDAKEKAGANYQFTQEKFESNELTTFDKIIEHVEWVLHSPPEAVSGRNFSTVSDMWGSKELEDQLKEDRNMYKLRRSGNDWLKRDES